VDPVLNKEAGLRYRQWATRVLKKKDGDMIRYKLKAARSLLLPLLFFLCVAPGKGAIAQQGDASLSQDEQTATARGLAAAAQEEWEIAVKHFEEAQKAAPTSPHTLLNLALGYEKMGGRELAAIAWFRAYVALAPKAANVDQVRSKIAELEVNIEVQARRSFKKAIAAAESLVDGRGKEKAWRAVIKELVKTGQVDWARQIAQQHCPVGVIKILTELALGQVRCGRLVEARQIFDLAEVIIPIEAESKAKDWNGRWPDSWMWTSPLCPPVGYQGWKECEEKRRERERKWKLGWRKRAPYWQGVYLICLAAALKEAGFGKSAFQAWKRGSDLELKNRYWKKEFGKDDFKLGLVCSEVILQAAGSETLNVIYNMNYMGPEGKHRCSVVFDPGEVDRPIKPSAVPSVAWTRVAQGETKGSPIAADFHDTAFLDLPGQIKLIKEKSTEEVPRCLAELASRLYVALQFLRTNRPRGT
jgi:tetratricopeptide (TPR) repeat protein